MNSIISDTNTYKKLDFDPTDKYVKSIRKELESLKNNLHIYDKLLITSFMV